MTRTLEAGACALVLSLGLVAPGAAFELQPVQRVPIAPLRPEQAPRPPEWMERFVPDPATGFGFRTREQDSQSGIPVAEQVAQPGAAASKAAAPAAPAGQASPFSIGQGYRLGGWCYSLAIARFHGNGQMDIAAAEYERHTIQIFLNNGLANYTDFDTIALDGPPYWVTAGDFNDDGNQDLAVAINTNPGRLAVLDGRGDGTFAPARTYAAGPWPDYVAAGDLDGDGRPDLVVSNYSPGSISVFINHGSAGFAAGVEYPTGAGAAGIGFADLDADGALDVIVANASCPTVTVWHNAGDGTLDVELLYPADGVNGEVVAGDFDGDGWLDVAASLYDGFDVFWNDGAGSFSGRDKHRGATGGDYFGTLASSDVDRDGLPDVAIASSSGWRGSTIEWYRGAADRALGPGGRYWFFPTRDRAYIEFLRLADVDGNGTEDLVLSAVDLSYSYSGGRGMLWVMRRIRGRVFEGFQDYDYPLTSPAPPGPGRFVDVATVDFERKGRSDLLVGDTGRLVLMRSESEGVLEPPVDIGPGSLSAAQDLNGDGRTDVILSTDDTLVVRLCREDGTLGPADTVAGRGLDCVADFDGDEKPDLLVETSGGSKYILVNDGSGGFLPPVSVQVDDFPVGPFDFGTLAAGDFDGDGRADLAVSWFIPGDYVIPGADSVAIFHNDDGGRFSRFGTYLASSLEWYSWYERSVWAGDLNRDGHADLAVLTNVAAGPGKIAVLLNRGDGTFDRDSNYWAMSEDPTLLVADFDMDGAPDFATISNSGISLGYLTVRMNLGDGTFGDDELFTLEHFRGSLTSGDLDGDGMPELAFGFSRYEGPAGVSVIANTLPAGPTPTLVSLVDARVVDDRVLLTWFAAGTPPGAATVMRRDDGTWSDRARLMPDGTGRFTFEDRDVQPGARYAYRLRFSEGASAILTAEVEVAIPALAFALEPPRPNPTAGDLVVSFTLPAAAPARLELLDVSGRRVRAHALDRPAPGRHTLDLSRGASLPAGIYWVRLTQDARTVATRAVVLR